jgi:hypothetical protein
MLRISKQVGGCVIQLQRCSASVRRTYIAPPGVEISQLAAESGLKCSTLREPGECGRTALMDVTESCEIWETPSFEEVDMNAEIGSYTPDYDGI